MKTKNVDQKKSVVTMIIMILAVVLSLASVLGVRLYVKADVIWEPEDTFYQEHAEQCNYEGRSYLTNGKDGYVIVYDSPKATKKIDAVTNEQEFYVSFTYEKWGTKWGVVNYTKDSGDNVESSDQDEQTGWVRMKDMTVVYDEQSFSRDHNNQITQSNEKFDLSNTKNQVYIWSYPGSKEVKGEIKKENINSDNSLIALNKI